jgi:Ca2+/H+ antiporter
MSARLIVVPLQYGPAIYSHGTVVETFNIENLPAAAMAMTDVLFASLVLPTIAQIQGKHEQAATVEPYSNSSSITAMVKFCGYLVGDAWLYQ